MDSTRIMALLAAGKQYKSFSLHVHCAGIALLPDKHEIVLDTQTGYYAILNVDTRSLATDGTFSLDELRFMLILLEKWPSYVPSEKILQYVLQQEPVQVTQCDQVPALLHDLAARCSHQMRQYGIDIQKVGTFGYKIGPFTSVVEGEKGVQI